MANNLDGLANDREDLCKQIAEKFNIPLSTIEKLFTLFHGDLKHRILKEYLAHIISAVEKVAREITGIPSVIIELRPLNIEDEFFVAAANYNDEDDEAEDGEESFDIFYPENLGEKQKRFYIAHELAHLYLKLQKRHLPANLTNYEELCSIFAIIALDDRSQFYDKKAKDYTYKPVGKLIDMARLLHDKMMKRN